MRFGKQCRKPGVNTANKHLYLMVINDSNEPRAYLLVGQPASPPCRPADPPHGGQNHFKAATKAPQIPDPRTRTPRHKKKVKRVKNSHNGSSRPRIVGWVCDSAIVAIHPRAPGAHMNTGRPVYINANIYTQLTLF